MVQLLDEDIRTREVLDWKGLHLFHFRDSSCSQKTRIFCNLKGIAWESHHIDLRKNEQWDDWYLGINPRGLVPALVLDGEVHIESNDIISLLDRKFPENRLIPEAHEDRITELLKHEDDLHLDIRTLNFRFTQPRGRTPRSKEQIRKFRNGGSGTVRGTTDIEKSRQVEFWQTVVDKGLTDDAVRGSVSRLRAALDQIDEQLAQAPWLLGEDLTILDIAWFIYVMKMVRCQYPLDKLHARVAVWYQSLLERPEFSAEIQWSDDYRQLVEENLQYQRETGTTLSDIAGLH